VSAFDALQIITKLGVTRTMSAHEAISRVKNPLAMVALFATISEVAMAAVITQLPDKLQQLFIWFVMGFPVVLVLLFFFVLYRKPAVFFAPGDYKREELYVASIGQNTPDPATEQRLRILEEALTSIQDFLSRAKLGATEQAEYLKLKQSIERRQELETNALYAFMVGELRLDHETTQRLIANAADALELSRLLEVEVGDRRKAARIAGLVSSFPSATADFQRLKVAVASTQGKA
jgi:hypothetical protein